MSDVLVSIQEAARASQEAFHPPAFVTGETGYVHAFLMVC